MKPISASVLQSAKLPRGGNITKTHSKSEDKEQCLSVIQRTKIMAFENLFGY